MGGTKIARDRARRAFLRAVGVRPLEARPAALAAIGTVGLARTRSDVSGPARTLLGDCLEMIPRRASAGWNWPEERLSHDNAVLCDALIVGGAALGRSSLVHQGLTMLRVLMEIETGEEGRLSVTGDRGRAPREKRSVGVQRPSDVAAIADACAHAFSLTGDLQWRRGVWAAWAWFAGFNDLGVPVYDSRTGAARNVLALAKNSSLCGAESTLAALSTLQRIHEVGH
jgi:hypothetical protein